MSKKPPGLDEYLAKYRRIAVARGRDYAESIYPDLKPNPHPLSYIQAQVKDVIYKDFSEDCWKQFWSLILSDALRAAEVRTLELARGDQTKHMCRVMAQILSDVQDTNDEAKMIWLIKGFSLLAAQIQLNIPRYLKYKDVVVGRLQGNREDDFPTHACDFEPDYDCFDRLDTEARNFVLLGLKLLHAEALDAEDIDNLMAWIEGTEDWTIVQGEEVIKLLPPTIGYRYNSQCFLAWRTKE